MDKKRYILVSPNVVRNAINAVMEAPNGYSVTISEPNRSLDQNAMFHAICSDIAKSGHLWAGKPRKADEWKVLLVSGHTIATKGDVEIVPGIENEFVNIRESTANMGVRRMSSLIEYSLAWCAKHDIPLTDTRRYGFTQEAA